MSAGRSSNTGSNNTDAKFLRALRPVVDSLGASVVPPRSAAPGDLPVRWDGEIVGYVRAGELHGALDRLVGSVERELGGALADLDRAHKQEAVRRLDQQGAFRLRGAVEEVAALMGVSKVTLYNYLNAIERSRDS